MASRPEAMNALRSHAWPENLRELFGVLQDACRRAKGSRIEPADLPFYLKHAALPAERHLPLDALLEQVERRLIALALRLAQNNQTRAAELLEIWRPRLQRRMEKFGFKTDRMRGGAMQQTQVLTFGLHGVLAERLRELAQAQRFRLRETSQLPACRNLLQSAAPSVLVLMLGRDLERELALLEQVHACVPTTATIVVGEADHPALAGLVWELGATFRGSFRRRPVEVMITEVIAGLLREKTP